MVFSNDMIKSILEGHIFDEDIYQRDRFQCEFEELVEGITVELTAMADTECQLLDIAAEEQMLKEEMEAARQKIISHCGHHSTTTGLDRPGELGSTICDTCEKDLTHGS